MTIQELQERYQFNRETPIVIGDRCKVFYGKLEEDAVLVIADLSPRIIAKEPVDSFEAGATFSFEGTSETSDTYVFGSVQYTIRMLDNYSEEIQQKVEMIIKEKDEESLRQHEKDLLYALRLPELDRTQKLLDIKSLYKQELYDETFKAIAYDYADDLLLDGETLYLLGDMCEKGMGTFRNVEQARQFFARAAEVGVTNAQKRVEMIDEELNRSQTTEVKAEESVDATPSASRLKRKSGPVNRRRGLSKKNKIRYTIIGSFSFILGLFISSIFSFILSFTSNSSATVTDDSQEINASSDENLTESDVYFKKLESDLLKQMADLRNYKYGMGKLKEGVTMIEQAERTNDFTATQSKRLTQLSGFIMGQISAMNDNKKEDFWIKHKSKAGETVISIANHYKVPEKNVLDSEGKTISMDRIFKNNEIVKVGIPALFFDHKILPGESIGTISNKYDIQPEDIRKLNELPSDVIHPGQELRVYIRE
ncbi:LysM peptidoglycan-binding domain-containing protein [Flammeovirga aprica]|uniref:LysM peptidoglycan-binding domain-containing protein n=1 Tax=Flammeovirga aprica JL-4 TaxID=694437 RepID=A0A7X9XDG6_9BACT|nr:LysM peptidoglycan-binding domain-containing protein [Flammeovirga aprica]NME72778.1 LysM peptidoglycan-binding domain-containing protein [Flammeovirga aprica JL-4]